MKIISLDRKSIKIKLATAFVITSIIPILLVILFIITIHQNLCSRMWRA